ncbi:hypothetical protein GGI08_001018 [Coemansia sp. S2]|nr:hypothetical protein GGI08_001018 [Coemansia sp. S2]
MSAPAGSGKGGGRELKANPFGNYSLMEAQQPTRNNNNNLGNSGHGPSEPPRPAPLRETPFSNYSFKEAQLQTQSIAPLPPTAAAEPSSPTVSISNTSLSLPTL